MRGRGRSSRGRGRGFYDGPAHPVRRVEKGRDDTREAESARVVVEGEVEVRHPGSPGKRPASPVRHVGHKRRFNIGPPYPKKLKFPLECNKKHAAPPPASPPPHSQHSIDHTKQGNFADCNPKLFEGDSPMHSVLDYGYD